MGKFPEELVPNNFRQRQIPSAEWLGFEFYDDDPLHQWLCAQLEVTSPSRQAEVRRPLAIEFGGASGFKAMGLAQRGYDVKIFDRIGEHDVIKDRNDLLDAIPRTGRIELHVTDVRSLTAQDLKRVCGDRAPVLGTAFQFIHFLKDGQLPDFFAIFADTLAPQALLGISYQHPSRFANNKNHGLAAFHSSEKVIEHAQRAGFGLIEQLPDRFSPYDGVTRQIFRLER